MYVYPQNIQKYTSTNIKTSLNTAALAFDSIKNLGTDLNPATLAAYNTQLSGLTATQQKMALSTTNLTLAQQKQVLSYIAETAAAKSLTAQQIAELSIDQKQALIKAGLITQEQIETGVTLELSKAQLQKIITSDAISTKDKELILGAFGVTGANLTETSSWEVLGTSIKKATAAMLKWLFLTPAGWATLAITAIAGTIVAYNKWGDTLENNRKKLEELKSEAQTISSDLQTFNSELQTTQQRISELESKGNLTFTEAEELENLRKQNNELQRSIDLLKLKEKENNKGKNKTFVKTMQKNVDVEDERVQTGRLNPDDTAETEMITEAELIERKFNTLDELQEKLRHASTETEKKAIQEQIGKITKYLSECNEQYIEDAEGIDYIQNPTTEDDKKVNEWLDYINDFQDKMAIAMGGDNAKENAFNRLVDNWKFDEALNPLQKLGKEGKVTLDELKKRMDDPVFVEFVNKLIDIGFISDTTDGSLRFLASAFNGTTQAARSYVNQLSDLSSIKKFIGNIDEEAKALGTTKEALGDLIQEHILFNNTGLDTSGQISALQLLGSTIDGLSGKTTRLISLLKYAAGDFSGSKLKTKENGGNYTEDEIRNINARRQGNAQAELDRIKKEWESVQNLFKDTDTDTPPYTPTDDDKNSGSDKKNEALDNYLKDAENRYKVHQDETKYINDLNYALQNLVKTEDERLDVTGKINEAYRDLADNRIKDLEHQIDLTKELKGEDADVTKQLEEIQRVSHQEANRLRSMGYDDNSNEIQALQKTWWDAENQKLEWRLNNSKDWIEERNRLDDWHLFDDNEVKAWERVIKWLKEEYPHAVDEIKEAEESLFEARENNLNDVLDEIQRHADNVADYYDKINDKLDDRITKEEALLQIMQGQTDATSKLMDVQTEIDKAIRDSRISLQYLDEKEREGIFNEEDYNKLSKKIKETQEEIDRDTQIFYQDVIDAYNDKKPYLIESITAEYERQVAMKERELEIAQAQVDLTKKQLQLNNVLAEKNVKQLVERNGQYIWEWVADTDKVRQATEELMDAEAEIRQQEYKNKQQEAIDEQQRRIDSIKAEQAANDYRVEKMNEYVDDLGKAIENCVDPIRSFEELAVQLGDASGDIVVAFRNAINSISGMGVKIPSTSSSSSGGSGGGSYSGSSGSNSGTYYSLSQIASMSPSERSAAWHGASEESKYYLHEANKADLGETHSYDDTTGKWKKHADGTRYTPGGMTLLGEEGFEAFINRNGHLIPIAQPTIGNIDSGGVVFNTEQMNNLRSLWDLSNLGKVNVDTSLVNRTIPSGNSGTQNTFTGGIVINAPRDYNDFVRQLTQRIKTKSI